MKATCNLPETVWEYKADFNREENLLKIIECMKPVIGKYVCRTRSSEREDLQQELILAVIEAANKIETCDHEGKGVIFFGNAVRNRYHELYRKSKTINLEDVVEWEELDKRENQNMYDYQNIEFREDLKQLLQLDSANKEKIADYILEKQWSDLEIAKHMKLSRQYVHQCKKEIFKGLLEYSETNA